MLQSTKNKLMVTYINIKKKEIIPHDSDLYWPTSIKYTIQWFPFLAIMEHTANIINPKKEIIPSLLD